MTDSYIDLNVEHYLRNGELKGAVKELNTIINGEESNKSLSELVEDLKKALNYLNWGYWAKGYPGPRGDIKTLKEGCIRIAEESIFSFFLRKIPIIYRGNSMYCKVGSFLDEVPISTLVTKSVDFRVEFTFDGGGQVPYWFVFGEPYYNSDYRIKKVNTVFRGSGGDITISSKGYSNYSDVLEEGDLIKIGEWRSSAKKPTEVTFRKYSCVYLRHGLTGRMNMYDVETGEYLRDWNWGTV